MGTNTGQDGLGQGAGSHGVIYGATVFLSSAALLMLEMAAARLLAPYVGASLYTWTAIIGVILAGLSIGNWIGGVLADRGFGHRAAGLLLLASSLTALAILPLLPLVGGSLQRQGLDLVTASFLFVLALFLAPAILLGVITPLVTTLYLQADARTGRVVGRMHALGAIGSIAGTLVTGLVLVQWLGTRNVVLVVVVLLFLLSVPFFTLLRERGTLLVGVILLALVGGLAQVSGGLKSPCTEETAYYCLRVVDEPLLAAGPARTLVIDHMVHSTNVERDPRRLVTPYVQVMDRLIERNQPSRPVMQFFFAGGGAYTHPRAVAARYPGAGIVVSEIDPRVTQLAREQLYYDDDGALIVHQDSRSVLSSIEWNLPFDVMVTDVFHDVGIPWHLTTREFAAEVRADLADDGLYLVNVIDVFPGNRLVRAMAKTLAMEFAHVQVWIPEPPEIESRLTFVLAASNAPLDSTPLVDPGGGESRWYEIGEFVHDQARGPETPLLTDDYAPVERLLGRLLTTGLGT